jgi:hypothetical protein
MLLDANLLRIFSLLTKRNPLGMVVLLPFASGKAEMLQL